MPWDSLRVVTIASLIRLIDGFGFGVVILFILRPVFSLDMVSQKVLLIESGMPAAALAVFFIQYIEIDQELMSSIIAFTTVLSLLTIPLWFWVAGLILN
jgi:predicted permease